MAATQAGFIGNPASSLLLCRHEVAIASLRFGLREALRSLQSESAIRRQVDIGAALPRLGRTKIFRPLCEITKIQEPRTRHGGVDRDSEWGNLTAAHLVFQLERVTECPFRKTSKTPPCSVHLMRSRRETVMGLPRLI